MYNSNVSQIASSGSHIMRAAAPLCFAEHSNVRALTQKNWLQEACSSFARGIQNSPGMQEHHQKHRGSYWGGHWALLTGPILQDLHKTCKGWDKYSECKEPVKVYLLQNLFLRSEAENKFTKERSFLPLKRSWWYRPTRSTGLWFFYCLPPPFLKDAQKPHYWVLWRGRTCPCVAWLTPLQATQTQPPPLPQQAEWKSIRAASLVTRAFPKPSNRKPCFLHLLLQLIQPLLRSLCRKNKYMTVDTCQPGIKPTMRGKNPSSRYWTQNKGVIPVITRLGPSLWRCNSGWHILTWQSSLWLFIYLWSDACSSALP